METSREVFFLDLVRVFNPGICEGLAGAQQRLVSVQVAEGIFHLLDFTLTNVWPHRIDGM
jgi:hypothetical protein